MKNNNIAPNDLLSAHFVNQDMGATHDQFSKKDSPTQFSNREQIGKLVAGAKVLTFYIKTFGCQMNVADSVEYAHYLEKCGFLPTENLNEAKIVLLNTCTVRQHAEDRAFSFLGQLKQLKNKNKKLKIIVAGCVAQRLGQNLKRRFPYVDLVVGAKDIDCFPQLVNPLLTSSPVHQFTNSPTHPAFTDAVVSILRSGSTATAEDGQSQTLASDEVSSFTKVSEDRSAGRQSIKSPNHPITPACQVSAGRQLRNNPITAFVTIMRGCENFCSYCIVPYVRGKEKSRPVEEIISEIKCLVEQGVKEVTLLGQNVNSYRSRAFSPIGIESHRNDGMKSQLRGTSCSEMDFAELLSKVNKIDGLERIRFVTSHPKDLKEKIILAMRDLDKVCEHLHLPVQAGANQTLEKMNRKYIREDYLSLVEKIKKTIPGIAITTDIIVGFPGETEEDFQQTLDLVEKVEFDSAYTFKYSPRPGTTAEKLPDDVPLAAKEERLKKLNELCKKISARKNKEFIGSVQEVLVEKSAAPILEGNRPEGLFLQRNEGRTRTNKIVFLTNNSDLVGRIIKVKITEAYTHSLIGELGLQR